MEINAIDACIFFKDVTLVINLNLSRPERMVASAHKKKSARKKDASLQLSTTSCLVIQVKKIKEKSVKCRKENF